MVHSGKLFDTFSWNFFSPFLFGSGKCNAFGCANDKNQTPIIIWLKSLPAFLFRSSLFSGFYVAAWIDVCLEDEKQNTDC